MRQTKKSNQWYFGMKTHIGVDSKLKQIHSVAATAANVHDSQMLEGLLHGGETRIWGDATYTGQTEAIRRTAPCAQNFTCEKGRRNQPLNEIARTRNRTKSRVRARVEHVFAVIKRGGGFTKVRYRGLAKNNAHALFVLCALSNLYMSRRRLCYVT